MSMMCPDFLCACGVENAPCFFEAKVCNVSLAVCSDCPAYYNCTYCFHYPGCVNFEMSDDMIIEEDPYD